MIDLASLIENIVIAAPPVIFAITLHEAAHGYVARHFGDPTAWLAGRISLNPLRHVDPVGTLLVPALILATSYFAAGSAMLFGWAKPVPVDFSALRHPKRDMLWVAAAGPAANVVMAIGWALLLKDSAPGALLDSEFLNAMALAGVRVNLMLMIFNLIPIPPLDGGRVLTSLLPQSLAYPYSRIEPYGLFIIMGLLLLDPQIGFFNSFMRPALRGMESLIRALVGA